MKNTYLSTLLYYLIPFSSGHRIKSEVSDADMVCGRTFTSEVREIIFEDRLDYIPLTETRLDPTGDPEAEGNICVLAR